MLMSARQWSARGFRIRTGAVSYYRGSFGTPLFSRSQVTQWERPRDTRPREYVVVDGYTYRRV